MLSRGASAAGRDGAKLDQNRVALLADTHISADPNLSYPGTKWPGSPVPEHEHESVNMAQCLADVAKNVIALNPRPAHLIINGDCAMSRGTEAEYKELLRLLEPVRLAGITVHATIESTEPIKAIYSPTHPIEVVRKDDHNAVISFEQNNYLPKNQMAIYWHTADENVGVSTMTYRDGEEGTFMLMMAPTVDPGDIKVLPKDIFKILKKYKN